jgi:ParB family chromosome partitioning protein
MSDQKLSKLEKMMQAGKGAALEVAKTTSVALVDSGFGLKDIKIDLIDDNPRQTRLTMDQNYLKELADTIKKDGLMQPISVIKSGDRFILRAGQRRLAAHKLNNMATIKAIVEDIEHTDKGLFEASIIENAHRQNVDPLELAISFEKALEDGFYSSQSELAAAIGKTEGLVSQYLSILKLSSTIKDRLSSREISVGVKELYKIQKIKDEVKQLDLFNLYLKGMSSYELDQEVKKLTALPSENKSKKYFDEKKRIVNMKLDIKRIGKDETIKILQELIAQIKNL